MSDAEAKTARTGKVRKAVITIREGKAVDVSIKFLPAGMLANPTICTHVGMIAFRAAVAELRQLEQDEQST